MVRRLPVAQQLVPGLLALALVLLPAAGVKAQEGVPVGVAESETRTIFSQLQVTGTVTSARSARLSAATSGQVAAINVDAGSRVTTGDVLLTLDPEIPELEYQSADARQRQAQLALDDARRRLQEARELVPQRSIAESVVRDLEAEVAEDEAALRAASAEALRRKALLERTRVRAPFNGVVAAKLTEVGEWVNPGQAVVSLVSNEELRLDFAVADDYLGVIDENVTVRYRVGLDSGDTFPGVIATAVPVSDPSARTFLLRVNPVDERPVLVPGMSVSAQLQIPSGREGVVVARDAVVRYPDGRSVVWVIESGDTGPVAAERLIRPGLQFAGQVEIVSGLEAGEQVVVRGNETLRAGQPVQVNRGLAGASR
jgi:RND family efflux transporter MFP subunit